MEVLKKTVIITLCLMMIPTAAVIAAAAKQRSKDGPNRVFSGGPLVSGTLHTGAEPDWSFVNQVPTVELQLLAPPQSRRIWVAEADGKLFVWSGYMNSLVGRLWKSWPKQASKDGRAVVRIEGTRYERELVRVQSGDVLDELSETVTNKYPSQLTRAAIEAGDVWIFEVAPRDALPNTTSAAGSAIEEGAPS